MQNAPQLRQEIISALETLPLDGLKLLAEFVAFLQDKFNRQSANGTAQHGLSELQPTTDSIEKQSEDNFLLSIVGQSKSGQHDVSERDEEILAQEIGHSLNQLRFLTDQELWQAAKSQASVEDNESMQRLLEKQQREGLTAPELEQVQTLSARFNQIMLVRAKAAVLLTERGHDISILATPL